MSEYLRVLLIRHGETDHNIQGRWQGMLDTPLNDEGRQQAQRLAQYLQGQNFDHIYSSDLSRAFETGQIIGAVLGIEPQPDERLREINMGVFQGLTYAEIEQRYPNEVVAMQADYLNFAAPDGESRLQMQARAYEAWQAITTLPGKRMLIVTHGGTIAMLLLKLFPNSPELSRRKITNTSITTLEYRDDGWHLVEAAATPHLQKHAEAAEAKPTDAV